MIRNPFRDLDHKKLRRSSDVLQTQNDYYKIVNRRILIFSMIVILLFSTITIRLVFIQVRDHEDYTTKLVNYSSQQQRFQTPRGEIYDRNGKLVVKTASAHNITYFPPKDVTSNEKWELAQKFAKQFHIKHETFTKSDMQDLYLFLYRDENGNADRTGNHLLSDEELATLTKASDKDKLVRSRITEKMVDEIASEEDKNAFSVYLLMNQSPSNSIKVIVEDTSNEDVAYLMEHKDEYRGFDVDFGSWKREYPYKDTLRDVLGSVTTTKQGVPSEEREYYEALGYSLTDRVGSSGLEKQYEQLLSGTPKVSEVTFEKDGTAVLNEISAGKKGYNLHLTVDIELQKKVDDIMTSIVKQYAGTSGREAFNQAFVLLMNPNTGEIYALSGAVKNKDGSMTKFASGTYLNNYQVGSVAKGATVYMILNEGVQTVTSTEYDTTMNIAGEEKSSFMNLGVVDAVRALEVSSNVYMWKSIIKLAGGTYVSGQPLNISNEATAKTLTKMRQYYSMFGLGTKTGLDVPNEALGIIGYTQTAGNLLDYSIGQYDTYSPIQLGQFVSTIANGGKKVQPKLVNTASEVNSNYTIYENKTKVLSQLSGNLDYLKTVQQGFRACITGNHCGVELNAMDKGIAAKTGTAQVREYKNNKEYRYTNVSEIGYAPYDDPEVAFVCSAPTSAADSSNQEASICSTQILPKVLKEYFKKYD